VARLYLKRTISGFEPSDAPSRETWKKFKLGESYRSDVVKPRNYRFHCLCFALLNLTFENQEQYGPEQFNLFRKMVAIEAGHSEIVTSRDGEIWIQAGSLSYDELDDVEFEALFPKMMGVCANILHDMDLGDLKAEVVKYAIEQYGYKP
jgi:hypothetical protein